MSNKKLQCIYKDNDGTNVLTIKLSGVTFIKPQIFRYIWKKYCKSDSNHKPTDLPKIKFVPWDEPINGKHYAFAVKVMALIKIGDKQKWAHIGWVPAQCDSATNNGPINEFATDILKSCTCNFYFTRLFFKETNSTLNAPIVSAIVQMEWKHKNL